MHTIRLSIGTFVPMLRKTYIIGSKSMIAFLFLIINSIMNGNNILNMFPMEFADVNHPELPTFAIA